MAERPNIVFLFTDDQRFDTIQALGNPEIHTPNMDWLVEQGTAFTHACIPGGSVPAVCMPSRAMVHTGRTLFHLLDFGTEIPEDHALLGETFHRAGYRTCGIGKWHNGKAGYHRSFTDGAEIFFGGMVDHWNVPAYHFDPTGAYAATRLAVEDIYHSNKTIERRCDHIHVGKHSTDTIADASIAFLHDAPANQPFLLYTAFLAPHDPRTMPRQYLEMYDPERISLPGNFLGGHPFDNGALHIRDEELAGFPRTPEETRRHLAEYYAMISHLDARIGDIIEAVRQRGQLEQTIFVLAGDNGLALGQHGLFGKQSLYEHSIRVPLVFAGPGIPRGSRTAALVYLLDLFPTLCELTGVPIPDTVEGISMLPSLQSAASGRDSLYLAYAGLHRGVRNERYKLIEYVVNSRHTATQLFDLRQDPLERCNLADDQAHTGLLTRLQRDLLRFRDEWDDCASTWGQTFWEHCKFTEL
ncbi:MAG: sulfatase-like hydrolase/transferase [Armatimonadota bacterium]